jgi:predicted peptidase
MKFSTSLFVAAVATLALAGSHLAAVVHADEAKAVTDVYSDQTINYTGGKYKDEVFHYRLMQPAKIEEGKKYPVILFLHGAGERGSDNKAQLKYFPEWMADAKLREKYPCFVIAPQCRNNEKWSSGNWGAKRSAKMDDEPTDQMKVALAALDHVVKTYPVDSSRLYLTGLSMGGFGSWELAIRQPERFAAVAPICGGGDESQAAKLVKIPIWAWHGDADPAVPVERSRNMIAAIKAAGGSPKYTELKGVGHDSWNQAYHGPDNLIPWMFEQKRAK